MKKLLLIFLTIIFALTGYGQKAESAGPKFDIDDFNKKFEVARWLVEYDNVAWKTTDFLMQQDQKEIEKLGSEWFCFQDKDKKWHAVYGKLTDGKYEAIFHFVMDTDEKITRTEAKIDQTFLNKHASALAIGQAKLEKTIPEGSPRFNQYIRQNPDKTFSVWLLPAFQPNGVAVFGGEAIYTIDAAGQKIIKDESYYQDNFRGFNAKPPREIWLNYTEMEKPSLGAIFFVWYYRPYFTQIFIDNAKSTSTVIKAGNDHIWTHVEKEPLQKPKSN